MLGLRAGDDFSVLAEVLAGVLKPSVLSARASRRERRKDFIWGIGESLYEGRGANTFNYVRDYEVLS